MSLVVVALALPTAGHSDLVGKKSSPVAIYGGKTVAPGEHEAVVAIDADGALCTGTVVSSHLVLTAAHCLAGISNPSRVKIVIGNDLRDPLDEGHATGFGVHPDFCGGEGCPDYEIFDYAYIQVADEIVIEGGLPQPLADQDELARLMRPGQVVTVVGFGEADMDDDGNPYDHGAEESIGIKREVDVGIVEFTENGVEFLAGGDGKDSCIGDSGGPAFYELDDGTVRLAGVLSRGYDPCGEGGYYGVPLVALPWIEKATGESWTRDAEPGPGCACMAGKRDLSILVLVPVIMLVRRRRARPKPAQ